MLKAKTRPSKIRGSNGKKKADFMKRARAGMMGFSIAWIDLDPFSEDAEIAGGEIDHHNPVQRLICQDMWKRCSHWIVNTEFTWVVRMVVIFDAEKNGGHEFDFNYTGTLRGAKSEMLNDAMQSAFEEAHEANNSYPDGHKNKGKYLQTEFVAKIVGV